MTTDVFHFNETALFAKLRESLPSNLTFTQNLIESCDDMLYAWDSKDSCLLTLNWRAAITNGIDAISYQRLIPSTPQAFDVERLLIIEGSSLIVLIGRRGVSLLELPRRWGKFSLFMDGKKSITCNTTNLDSNFLSTNPKVEVRQVRWHNFSVTESNLLILFSDNTIRVYDDAILTNVWRVGPILTKYDLNSSDSTIPSGYDLGESVIDFDICPPIIHKSIEKNPITQVEIGNNSFHKTFAASRNSINQSLLSSFSSSYASKTIKSQTEQVSGKPTITEKLKFPIVLLRENGNIYILMVNADNSKPRLQGPLTITPKSTNNYGLESCAILVIESTPPTLIIAETVGKFHHAILIEVEESEDTVSDMDTSLNIYPSEYYVHVVETVELELGIINELSAANSYHCAIHLKKDYVNELRYFAYHNAGLHAISVNFIKELQRFAENTRSDDLNLYGRPSTAEYIICTKVNSGEGVNVVLGFVLLQLPAGLIVLLGSGQVITLKLLIDSLFILDAPQKPNKSDLELQSNDRFLGNFVDDIKCLLARDVTQPILSLDASKKEPTSVECYAILLQAMNVFRTQYFQRFEAARAELIKRGNATILRKQQQIEEIKQLEKEIVEVRDNAHRLAERFEDLQDKQDVITKQCQDLIRKVHTQLPSNSLADKEFADSVEQVKRHTQNMEAAIEKARERIQKNKYHIDKYNASHENKKIELPEKQERNIKDILVEISHEIDDQIKEVKQMNKYVGI